MIEACEEIKTKVAQRSLDMIAAMRKKLRSKKGRVIYGRRFASSEGANGIIKSARNRWKFLRTTLRRVENEWLERGGVHVFFFS